MTHKVSTMKEIIFSTNFTAVRRKDVVDGGYVEKLIPFIQVPDSILLTREQFNELRAKIAGDAFEAGEKYGYDLKSSGDWGNDPTAPDKQQYLSSLNSKEK